MCPVYTATVKLYQAKKNTTPLYTHIIYTTSDGYRASNKKSPWKLEKSMRVGNMAKTNVHIKKCYQFFSMAKRKLETFGWIWEKLYSELLTQTNIVSIIIFGIPLWGERIWLRIVRAHVWRKKNWKLALNFTIGTALYTHASARAQRGCGFSVVCEQMWVPKSESIIQVSSRKLINFNAIRHLYDFD